MLFSACCIASCEPAQIHGSISNMKMEIQKKIWTSRYKKGALTVAFVHTCALTACADPGTFVKGGPGPMARKQPGQRFFFCFFSPQLIYSLQKGSNGFITEKTILFQGSRGGPTFSGGRGGPASSGGVQILISIEPHITCDFPGGSGPPIPPSGSAHEQRSSKN